MACGFAKYNHIYMELREKRSSERKSLLILFKPLKSKSILIISLAHYRKYISSRMKLIDMFDGSLWSFTLMSSKMFFREEYV